MEFTDETYSKLIEELFEKHPTVQREGFGTGAYKPGIENMTAFDRRLGEPWRNFPSIHVAGTNGKGSVSSMLAAALSAEGMRTGLYTSPHLADFRERIKIVADGTFSMIPREYVMSFLTTMDLGGLSFFEITTGLAFSWFAREKVDAAVIEVGLGGRLDSTNIITPELSIITSIGLDHCALLGSTRDRIAYEKAGIFKSGVPALVATRDDETEEVFEKKAAEVHCPLFFGDDFKEDSFPVDLKGPCQETNLHTTLAALDLLGIDPDRSAIAKTAVITGLRGRWEKLQDAPEVICDIGHNPAALEINFSRLEEMHRPLFIVYGVMADKDVAAIRQLMPKEARYYLVAPKIARALPAEKLAEIMSGLDFTVCESVSGGVARAVEDASSVPGSLVYIGGSNYVVSECIINMYDNPSFHE